jgi:hypothetical protein
MGGVPKRFPQLKFAFLEGGVAWARSLYCDLVSHWEKRNREALENYNPAHINTAEFIELAARYGGRRVADRAETLIADHQDKMARGEDAASFDEWAPSGIGSAEEICEIFTQRFYFGCEGDDPLNAVAFDTKGSPFQAKLTLCMAPILGTGMCPRWRKRHRRLTSWSSMVSSARMPSATWSSPTRSSSGPRGIAISSAARQCTRPWIHYWRTAARSRSSRLRT